MRIPFELKTAQQEALDAAREVYRKAQEAAKEAIERAEKSDGVPVVITFQLPRGGGRVRWTMEFVVGKASVVNDMKAIIFVSATRDTTPPPSPPPPCWCFTLCLQARLGVPIEMQTMLCMGKELKNDEKLDDLDLTSGTGEEDEGHHCWGTGAHNCTCRHTLTPRCIHHDPQCCT